MFSFFYRTGTEINGYMNNLKTMDFCISITEFQQVAEGLQTSVLDSGLHWSLACGFQVSYSFKLVHVLALLAWSITCI